MSEIIIPDYFEPLVGWRGWHVETQWGTKPATLHSWNGEAWDHKKPFRAACTRNEGPKLCPHCGGALHKVPELTCSCGVYLFTELRDGLRESMQHHLGGEQAFGQCWFWGKCIQHVKGYRVEYAYPKALFSNNTELSHLYGIEVQPMVVLLSHIKNHFGADFKTLQHLL